jgi:hypothetical protein
MDLKEIADKNPSTKNVYSRLSGVFLVYWNSRIKGKLENKLRLGSSDPVVI